MSHTKLAQLWTTTTRTGAKLCGVGLWGGMMGRSGVLVAAGAQVITLNKITFLTIFFRTNSCKTPLTFQGRLRIQLRALPKKACCANSPLNTTVRKHKNGTFSNKTQSGVTYNTCTSVDNYNIGWCETESGWGNCDPLTACP